MVVSPDKKQALVGCYRTLSETNAPYTRLLLKGLDEGTRYCIEGDSNTHYGDELMYGGIPIDRMELNRRGGDFASLLFVIKKVN